MVSISELRVIKGLDAVANAFAGTVLSDVINCSNFHKLFFIVHKAVGATGTSTITVSACDNVTPSTQVAIPFYYQRDVAGAPTSVTAVAATGFTTTAGSSDAYIIEVDMKAMASTGYKYCCLKSVEVVASPVLGGIVILGVPRNYASGLDVTV